MNIKLSYALRAALFSAAYVGAILLFWLAIKYSVTISDYLVPWPSAVLQAVLSSDNRIPYHFSVTLTESLAGFVVANFTAAALALLFQLNSLARRTLLPIAIALKTTPIVALAPLFIIWVGTGSASKVLASALVSFFPMLIGLLEAMNQTPTSLVEYLQSLGASRSEVLWRLRLPYSAPEAFAALRVSSTLAVVGAVVGEFVGARVGLGYLILSSSYQLQTATTFAAIIMTTICGGLMFTLVVLAEKVLGVDKWRN